MRSARKCRSNHLEQLQGKLNHCNQVIVKLEKKIKAHRKYLQVLEQVNRGLNKKLPKSLKPQYPDACPRRCAHHLTYYQKASVKLHNKKRYHSKLKQQIEGIKTSAVHVNLGNQYTVEMVGSKDESYGNQIAQMDFIGKELHIRVPYFLESRYGKYLTLPMRLPKHGQDNLATAWFNQQAITYRFIQKSLREWEIHISFDVLPAPKQTGDVRWGAIGVDLNPGTIGWAKADKDGNLEDVGQIKTNIQSQPSCRTEAVVVEAVTQLTRLALNHKCPLVVEKLDFRQKKQRLRELNARHNRMLSNFAYSKFSQLLKARCFKLGIELIEVNPAYSSLIGLIKFMSIYGMNSATAAALVLARRAMYFSERPPARTAYQGMEPRKHVWSHWGTIGKRVKGSSRHSFYMPRLTVYSWLRPVRGGKLGEEMSSPSQPISATGNPWLELGEAGENPAGSRHTAGRRSLAEICIDYF